MADISNTDNRLSYDDIEDRIEELEAERKPWVAGWNMPGYMPDSEPAAFEDWESARDYIAEEMREYASSLEGEGHEELREELESAARDLDESDMLEDSEYGETVGNYHYWIQKAEKEGLDDSDYEELQMWREALEELPRGAYLIHESDFENYAEEFADDIGAIDRNAAWPTNCIDWERAARELASDFSSIDIGDQSFYYNG